VYALVAWSTSEGREIERARRALRLGRLKVSDREDRFASVIRCTADRRKPTSGPAVSGPALCGMPWRTSRTRSRSTSSSNARVGSMRALAGSLGGWGEVRQRGYKHLGPAPPEASHRAGLLIRTVQSFQPSSIAEKGPERRRGMSYNLPLLAIVGQHTRRLGRFTHWLRSAVRSRLHRA
jgi:hypothetical protein